jgi:hypothetical protein
MTYNQIRNRIRKTCEAHKQVRTFKFGKYSDFEDGEVKYTAVFVQDTPGAIAPGTHQAVFGFRLFFLDQTHLSEHAELNEQDVLSDCFSIALDIVAQLADPHFNDWRVSGTNNSQIVVDYGSDFTGGCFVDLSITTLYLQNRCATPSTLITIDDDEMQKLVYDETYIATGSEGNSFRVPEIVLGKKILFVTRESSVMYKVSNNPASNEYTWDGEMITYGTTLQADERTLILYRIY